MKKYERLQKMKPTDFKRLVGVKKETFEAMLEVCQEHHKAKKSRGGKPNTLSIADQLLLMLGYYREYRSMAHIAFDYDISEATVSRVIQEMESVLIQSGKFSLPGKKALYEDELNLSISLSMQPNAQFNAQKKAAPMLQWKEKATYSQRANRD